ncbi:transposase [Micrococcales bacterium 31B]|nr:transposase [Micrococcales bacterium 31B]
MDALSHRNTLPTLDRWLRCHAVCRQEIFFEDDPEVCLNAIHVASQLLSSIMLPSEWWPSSASPALKSPRNASSTQHHRPPSARTLKRQQVADQIGKIWIDGRKILGVRRLHAELTLQGVTVSTGLVWKIRQELGIAGIQPRASQRTTIRAADADADADERRDLVKRKYTPPVAAAGSVGIPV